MDRKWTPFAKEYNPLQAGSIDGTDSRPHDRGVERAMEAVYIPDHSHDSDPKVTLFVGRLNPETTETTLEEAFSKFGEVKNLTLIRDIVTGFSKQYAFIEYYKKSDALRAWDDGNRMIVDQSEVFVDWELGRTLPGWIPRRLGGGFGGRKESGQLRFGGRDRPFKKPIDLKKGALWEDKRRGDSRSRESADTRYRRDRDDGRRREESRRDDRRGDREHQRKEDGGRRHRDFDKRRENRDGRYAGD